MSNNTGKVIAILLALILAVLLFGREAVTPWLWVAGIVVVVGGLLWLVWRFLVFAYGDDVRQHLDETRANGGSMLLAVLFWISAAANVVVGIWAGVIAFTRWIAFRDAVEFIPFWWLPVCFLLPSFLGNELIKWWRQRRLER